MKHKLAIRCFCLLAPFFVVNAMRAAEAADNFDATAETVGPSHSGFIPNKFVTPVNQILTPAGWQIELPPMRSARAGFESRPQAARDGWPVASTDCHRDSNRKNLAARSPCRLIKPRKRLRYRRRFWTRTERRS